VYGRGAGHVVSFERGLRGAVETTRALLAQGESTPIFEATFDYDGIVVRIDILDRSEAEPRIVEVKSATRVKDHYLDDCAIQAWTLRQLGLPIRQVAVAHIDNQFVYQGDGRYDGLFAEADVTEPVYERFGALPDLVDRARATLAELDEPLIAIGPHCRTPHACLFHQHCAPVVDATAAAEAPFVGAGLREFADALGYPRYYLDFETVGFAVPIWKGTRPYETLPFQWSCHIDAGGARLPAQLPVARAQASGLLHAEFLDLSGEPPMRRCAETLLETLGTTGPILMYTGYERRVINELAQRYPDLAAGLHAIRERLVDLHPVTKQHYQHPAMQGSWSMKAVLPTIAPDLSYESLGEVQNGLAAQVAYVEAIKPETSAARRAKLRRDLSDYCRQDTLAMVRLVEFFARVGG
jgi:predicted RecB family nuclease